MIKIHIPGTPQGKGRARAFKTRSGTIGHYTPDKTKTYEGMIRLQAMHAMRSVTPCDAPVSLVLTIVMPIPDSWPAWKRELAESGKLLPTVKPDADNVEKAVKDALNGVVWRDDAQVVICNKSKIYECTHFAVGVHVEAFSLGQLPAQIKRKPENTDELLSNH